MREIVGERARREAEAGPHTLCVDIGEGPRTGVRRHGDPVAECGGQAFGDGAVVDAGAVGDIEDAGGVRAGVASICVTASSMCR